MMSGQFAGPTSESDVKQTVKGNTLSITVHLAQVNRSEAFIPTRLLYFKGSAAPTVTVSTNAVGVVARPYDVRHYLDIQNARRSFFDVYRDQLVIAALVSAWLFFSIFLVLWARRRDVENLRNSVDVVTKVIQDTHLMQLDQDKMNELSKEIVVAIWQATYARMAKMNRYIAVKPDKVRI